MMTRSIFLLLIVGALSCSGLDMATKTQSWDEAPPGPSASRANAPVATDVATTPAAARLASSSRIDVAGLNAAECEQEARTVYEIDKEKGWNTLRACVKKGNFTTLRPLLDAPWDHEIGARKNGALLLAQVIAMRGGDVDADIHLCNEAKIPLFSLSAAMGEPDAYAGRLLIVRGTVNERKRAKTGRTSLLVAETSLGGQSFDVQVGAKYSSTSSGTGSASASASSSKNGNASMQANVQHNDTLTKSMSVEKHRNTVEVTGKRLVVNVDVDDPFLKVKTDYIFLVRFDRVHELDEETKTELESNSSDDDGGGDEPQTHEAVVSVVGYFEPSTILTF
ncbi:MAG TPA: hypothetical protein VGO62_01980 [Myxococcota bacterium]